MGVSDSICGKDVSGMILFAWLVSDAFLIVLTPHSACDAGEQDSHVCICHSHRSQNVEEVCIFSRSPRHN